MKYTNLLQSLRAKEIVFKDVLSHIENLYISKTSGFKNGLQYNRENENQGSAKVLFFAKLNGLTKEETLELFAEHYDAVLNTPDGTDHQNIRQFQINGWDGVEFDGDVLIAK